MTDFFPHRDKLGAALAIGDLVRVVVRGSPRARIDSFMASVEGGAVLSRAIDGSRYWNVKDLVKITPKGPKG